MNPLRFIEVPGWDGVPIILLSGHDPLRQEMVDALLASARRHVSLACSAYGRMPHSTNPGLRMGWRALGVHHSRKASFLIDEARWFART